MEIHHLNCGTLRPRYPRMQGIIYCLLIETGEGLVLVDTGFGRQDYSNPSMMMAGFLWLMGVAYDEQETAIHQVESLGYDSSDVRHIVLTHLHLDHAGGLRDFPEAKVHLFKGEYDAAMSPRGLVERGCDAAHWSHGPDWVLHNRFDEEWYGFPALRVLKDAATNVFLVPLPGHTRGHCGVVIKADDRWLFNCGDAASPFHSEVDPHDHPENMQPLNNIPGWLSRRLIGTHVPRLRNLISDHGDEINLISSHDVYSFEKNKIQDEAGEYANG